MQRRGRARARAARARPAAAGRRPDGIGTTGSRPATGTRKRFARDSASSTAPKCSCSSTASHSGPDSRSRIEERIISACADGSCPRAPRSPGSRPGGGSRRPGRSPGRGGRRSAAATAPRDTARPASPPAARPDHRRPRAAGRARDVRSGTRPPPGREPQIVGTELEQFTASAHRCQRKVRLRPRREHQLERGRRMIDEPGQALAGGASSETQCQVIQDQRDRILLVQLVDQARQGLLEDRAAPAGCGDTGRLIAGQARCSASITYDHSTTGSLSSLVERQPRDRLPRGLGLCQAARVVVFPKPAGTCHQGESVTRPGPKPCSSSRSRGMT